MSSSPDLRPVAVLRGGDADVVRPVRLGVDLRHSPLAKQHTADPRLFDPQLELLFQQTAEAVRASAQDEGFAAGYEAGRQAALEEARERQQRTDADQAAAEAARREEFQTALGALRDAARRLEQLAAPALPECEDAILDAAVRLAEVLLGRELELTRDPGRDAIRRALALLPEDAQVVVRLNPADVALLGADEPLPAAERITVVADPSVSRGGCLADSGARHVDAMLDTALDRVARALRS